MREYRTLNFLQLTEAVQVKYFELPEICTLCESFHLWFRRIWQIDNEIGISGSEDYD